MIKTLPQLLLKCFGRVDERGVQTMCKSHVPKTTSTIEEFKNAHEREVQQLVSATECKSCPSTEKPKVGDLCPGLLAFAEGCVLGNGHKLDKGATSIVCSSCNAASNTLATMKFQQQREAHARSKWPGNEFSHDIFMSGGAKNKVAHPPPTPRKVRSYYTADNSCVLCKRTFLPLNSHALTVKKWQGDEGDVYLLSEYVKCKSKPTATNWERGNLYKCIQRGISLSSGANDDDDDEKEEDGDAQASVCLDCCARIGGRVATAIRKYLANAKTSDKNLTLKSLLDSKKKELLDIGAESLKDVTLDNFRNPNPIEMEVGCAWKNNAESNNLRAWNSSDFVSGYKIPTDKPVRVVAQAQRGSVNNPKNNAQYHFCLDLAASLARMRYSSMSTEDSEDLVLPGSKKNGVPFDCYICPDTFLKTGPMESSLLARSEKHTNSDDRYVPGFKELIDSVNVALLELDSKSQVSILINSPGDLTSSALNLLAVLEMIKIPDRVHVVWKVLDLKDGVGGTACVSDLLYFLRNRVDFGEFRKDQESFAIVENDCKNATMAARFFRLIEHESGKAHRKSSTSVEDPFRHRTRTFSNFNAGHNYDTVLSQDNGPPTQDAQDFVAADSQASETNEIPRERLKLTQTFLLSWREKPIRRKDEPFLMKSKGSSGEEWFTTKQLLNVKVRGPWQNRNDAISPHKKRTSENFDDALSTKATKSSRSKK